MITYALLHMTNLLDSTTWCYISWYHMNFTPLLLFVQNYWIYNLLGVAISKKLLFSWIVAIRFCSQASRRLGQLTYMSVWLYRHQVSVRKVRTYLPQTYLCGFQTSNRITSLKLLTHYRPSFRSSLSSTRRYVKELRLWQFYVYNNWYTLYYTYYFFLKKLLHYTPYLMSVRDRKSYNGLTFWNYLLI